MLSSSYPPNTAPATHLIAGPAIATTLTESDEIDPLLTARPSVVVERSTTGVPGGCNGNWLNGTACQWTGPDQMDAHPHLAKVRVAGSNPVFRSNIFRIGRERRERTAAGNRRAGPDRPTPTDRRRPGHTATPAEAHAGKAATAPDTPHPRNGAAGAHGSEEAGLLGGVFFSCVGSPRTARVGQSARAGASSDIRHSRYIGVDGGGPSSLRRRSYSARCGANETCNGKLAVRRWPRSCGASAPDDLGELRVVADRDDFES
jgi:hypothetical protein